jgi:membrane associated rhomboid family serine protease
VEQVPVTVVAVALTLLSAGLQMLCGEAHGLELSPAGMEGGEWWRVATYPLLHCGPTHALGAAAALMIFGKCVEPILGSRLCAGILVSGSLWGGILHWALLRLGWRGGTMLLGSLPAAYALLGAYAALLPEWRVGAASRWGALAALNSTPRPPSDFSRRPSELPNSQSANPREALYPSNTPRRIQLRAKHVGWIGCAIALLLRCTDWLPEIGPEAMLFACFWGATLTRWMGFGRLPLYKRHWENRSTAAERLKQMSWEAFVRLELDPVLEKIARSGIQSLTRAERRILDEARTRHPNRDGPAL